MLKRFAVKLYLLKHREATPEQLPGFTVDAGCIDAARKRVGGILERRGYKVRALSSSAQKEFTVIVEEQCDTKNTRSK